MHLRSVTKDATCFGKYVTMQLVYDQIYVVDMFPNYNWRCKNIYCRDEHACTLNTICDANDNHVDGDTLYAIQLLFFCWKIRFSSLNCCQNCLFCIIHCLCTFNSCMCGTLNFFLHQQQDSTCCSHFVYYNCIL